MSDTSPPRPLAGQPVAPSHSEGSYVDWPAILGGGVFALAISFLLISFGAGLGLSLTSPYRGEGVSAAWLAIAAGIWFAWVMVTGFGAGGYLAGRMRRRAGDATAPEVEARDGMHGLLVWATGALVGTILATLGMGGLLTAGAATTAAAVEVAGEAVSSDYFADLMLRDAAMAPATAAPETAASETDTPAAAPLRQPVAQPATTSDPAVQRQIAAILARSAAEGQMAERDSSYLAQVVAANSDLDQTAARARVDEVNAEIAEARATATAAVEKARVAGVVFGFIAAATLLIGAVAAFFAAAAGGRHRDEGLGLDVLLARR
ncbi:MAG: hypothetical protein ACK4HF_11825 [Paracoccaceae bacterium]